MHPLAGYGIGGLIGALACAFFYGYGERYQRIALAVSVGVLALGGAVLAWLALPAPTALDRRLLSLVGTGFAAKLAGYNLGIAFQVPSGGFSSARIESMIGFAIAAVVLALSAPNLKP